MNEAFDVEAYLDSRNIPYSTSGKNTSKGWANILCPNPLCGDSSNHCGINLSSHAFHCWLCGEKGTAIKLVRIIEDCSWEQARKIVSEFTDFSKPVFTFSKDTRTKIRWPKEFKPIEPNNIPQPVSAYLKDRQYDPEKLTRRYQLYYPDPDFIGKYKFRLIIPIFMNGRIVNYSGRDITTKQESRYKVCPNDEAELTLNQTFYGYDEHPENAVTVLVEGIFDKWRLGFGSLACFGTDLTPEQILLLKKKNPTKVIFLFDPAEYNQAMKVANKIWFCPVEVWELDGVKDPGQLTQKDADKLMMEINS